MKMYSRNGAMEFEIDNPDAKKSMDYLLTGQPCWKCGGAGGADAWKHTGWVCYRCNGSGKEAAHLIRVFTKEHLANLDAKMEIKQKAAAKKQALADAKAAKETKEKALAYLDSLDPKVKTELLNHSAGNEFLESLMGQVMAGRTLSEKQLDLVFKKQEMRLAQIDAADCPDGRVEITAKLISTKVVESQFGSQIKALWLADKGFKIWGTMTARLDNALQDNDKITFKATVTPSDRDPKFGFYKRPALV